MDVMVRYGAELKCASNLKTRRFPCFFPMFLTKLQLFGMFGPFTNGDSYPTHLCERVTLARHIWCDPRTIVLWYPLFPMDSPAAEPKDVDQKRRRPPRRIPCCNRPKDNQCYSGKMWKVDTGVRFYSTIFWLVIPN